MARGNAIGVYGDGATVRDNYLEHGGNCTATAWPHNTAHYSGGVRSLLWARNYALCLCQGYSFDSPHGLAVLDSTWNSSLSEDAEGSGVSSFRDAVAENVYFRDNLDIGNPTANKSWESFTSDGPGGAWAGSVGAAAAGATAVPLQAAGSVREGAFKAGEALVVMAGPTAGSLVRLAAVRYPNASAGDPGSAKVSQPLRTAVGGSGSFGAVMPWRGRMALEGNVFRHGTTFQFFGSGDDCHVVNNTFAGFGNISPWGLWYQGGYQPTLRTQFRGNTLIDGGSLRTVVSSEQANYSGPFVFSTVFRDNVLQGRSMLSVGAGSDLTVVEGNTYLGGTPPPRWPQVQANASRVIANNNHNRSVTN